jgi:hypothetical protein
MARLACLIGVVWLAAALPALADGPVIGTVEDLKGPSKHYRLQRDGHELPLRIFDQLRAGDVIVMSERDDEVRIRRTTDEVETIPASKSGAALEAKGSPGRQVSNLIASAVGLLTPWHDFVNLNVNVRGGPAEARAPLELPLVAAQGGTISAGPVSFTLAWLGGAAPFRVSLNGDRPVLEAAGLGERVLPPRPVVLTAGSYRLVLQDGAGQLVERVLQAVPAAEVPRPPPEPELEADPAPWRTTAEAVWLAKQDRGRWLLQAYVRVAPLAASFGPARIFADLLANGGPLRGR